MPKLPSSLAYKKDSANSVRDDQEFELEKLRQENDELLKELAASREEAAYRVGARRCCCLFGFLIAFFLAQALGLGLVRGAVNSDLPTFLQRHADWLLQHPLVPQPALDIVQTVFKRNEAASPGKKLAIAGLVKKHPVVFVPGFTSTAL